VCATDVFARVSACVRVCVCEDRGGRARQAGGEEQAVCLYHVRFLATGKVAWQTNVSERERDGTGRQANELGNERANTVCNGLFKCNGR
jgi:hypothetical protein